ncbi:MAG TPA: hypothetical protein VET23_12050 [Chitinophagaceae bacterium]|nr:hypothetical protein [Chitinophagaceae bacterium]
MANPNLWITIVRLPLQLVLIWWGYGFTERVYVFPGKDDMQQVNSS